jgi:hypothetical protein
MFEDWTMQEVLATLPVAGCECGTLKNQLRDRSMSAQDTRPILSLRFVWVNKEVIEKSKIGVPARKRQQGRKVLSRYDYGFGDLLQHEIVWRKR